MPYRLRNSFSSSMYTRIRSVFFLLHTDISRRPLYPMNRSSAGAMCFSISGCRFRNNAISSRSRGRFFARPSSSTVDAHNGSSPTSDRTLTRMARPSGGWSRS